MHQYSNLQELQANLLMKKFSMEDVVLAYLDKIKIDQPTLNNFITVMEDAALEQAHRLDEKIAAGETLGELAGVVLAIKDNILVKDQLCTAGSKILENYIAPYNATVIEKLLAADAIIIGKTNMDELACGSSNQTSYFGPVKNPLNTECVPGGSSGGSAAAVAAEHCAVALGSDTGGSIRQPASFCGLWGLKGTYGAVSRYGVTAMASSFDQIGPLAGNPDDLFKVFEILQGKDSNDLTTLDYSFDFKAADKIDIKKLRVGIVPEYFAKTDKPELYQELLESLQAAGMEVKEVTLPEPDLALAIYYILQPAELSTNLARLDGIRYGYHSAARETLDAFYRNNRGAGFGAEIKRRLILGTYVLSAEYYDAYYKKAQQAREYLRAEYRKLFNDIDLIYIPTTLGPAFRLDEKMDPLQMYLEDIFTVSANVLGVPALSLPLPCAAGELPRGAQFMAAWQREDQLQAIGQFIYNKIHKK
ncbi:MAG TPA: Asp-tRNA(Asn)/Glu-tRNA(Gln) amidotransferase subunit GatA [bacterium]|nr:Asp-tRNA(Asn)/Glu-tRNA(Gln) amidotransferase subunit GatA [bacterium]